MHCTGTIRFSSDFVLHNVFYIPSFNVNLLSVSALLKQPHKTITFHHNQFVIQDTQLQKMIGRGDLIEDLYVFKVDQLLQPSSASDIIGKFQHSVSCNIRFANKIPVDTWHARLGHISDQRMHVLREHLNICNNKFSYVPACTICPLAKQKQLAFHSNNHVASHIFYLIHCDIWGPFHTPTHAGHRYFISIVDDHSRYTWIHLLKNKYEANQLLQHFISWVKTQFNITVKCLRSDNAKELSLTNFLTEKGINHQFSCVERPQQNAVVERKFQHLLNVARALYFQSKVPISFWGECVATATYIINRIPSPILNHQTPFYKLYQQKPDYSIMIVFGSLCYTSTLPSTRHKFTPRAHPCVFIGYPKGYKGYKVYNLVTKTFQISRDVVFQENIFPFSSEPHDNTNIDPFPHTILPVISPSADIPDL